MSHSTTFTGFTFLITTAASSGHKPDVSSGTVGAILGGVDGVLVITELTTALVSLLVE